MKEKERIKKVVKANPVVEEVEEVEIPKESTIFDKYREHINTAKDGYLRNIKYAEAVEILRYVQDKTGHKLGLNMSCASCLLSLVKTFANLEK
jgi:hypothetical protein